MWEGRQSAWSLWCREQELLIFEATGPHLWFCWGAPRSRGSCCAHGPSAAEPRQAWQSLRASLFPSSATNPPRTTARSWT